MLLLLDPYSPEEHLFRYGEGEDVTVVAILCRSSFHRLTMVCSSMLLLTLVCQTCCDAWLDWAQITTTHREGREIKHTIGFLMKNDRRGENDDYRQILHHFRPQALNNWISTKASNRVPIDSNPKLLYVMSTSSSYPHARCELHLCRLLQISSINFRPKALNN